MRKKNLQWVKGIINNMHWICFQTNSRQEFLAKSSLMEKGFNVLLPFYLKNISHARKVLKKAYPIFPTYAFLLYDEDPNSLVEISHTRGVKKYLKKSNGIPFIVPDKIINAIFNLKQSDGTYKLNQNYLKPGDDVLIVDGVLSGVKAILKEYIDEQRANLLVNLLGRINLVNFDIGKVERA